MAGLLDLFSGRSSDIYGNGLLTPEQRGGLGNIGLLALAGKLGQLAGPSFSPVPDFGAALGQAAGAYGASQEGAGTAALNAILTGQKGRKLEQELGYYKQLGPILGKLAGQWPGADGGTAATPETGSTGGGAAAPPGAGGGGPGRMSYDQVLQLVLAKGFPADKAPIMAATIMAESGGNPSAANLNPSDPGGSYGLTQINAGAHGPKAKEALGNPDRAVELAYDISKGGTDFTPWSAYKSGAYKRFLPQGGAAPTAAAPAPAGGGGPLAVPAPNPLSDAEPMVGIPRPKAPAGAGPAAQAVPWAPGNLAQYARPGDKGAPITVEGVTYPSVSAWNRGMDARARATAQSAEGFPENPEATGGGTGQGAALEEPPGFAGRQLVAQLLARPPIDDVSQYRQVAGPGAADAAATPRAPLPVMGPTGVELPPMQGPLAAPAPAAAAPAAPGLGLLSLPGAPAAALPRVNPAYDALLRNLGLAGALAEGAGLKNVLGPIQQALEASPAYKGQVKTAEEAASDPFIRGRAEQKAQLDRVNDLAKSGGIIGPNGEVVPWQGFQDLLKANEKAKAEGTEESTQRQKILEFHLDNLKNGKVVDPRTGETLPARGAIELAQQQAAATTEAQERAKARVATGTAPGLARETETQKGFAAQDTAARAQALGAKESLYLMADARQQLEGAGIFSGALANPKMTIAQYYSGLTGVPNEQLVNTQVFLQQAGARAAAVLQAGTYGTGTAIGKTDLDAANRLANGDNTVTLEAIKRVFDLSEKTAHRKIEMFNDMIRKRDPNSVIEPPSRSVSAGAADDFSKMSLPDLTAAVTRGDLTIDQRKAIDKRFRELGH